MAKDDCARLPSSEERRRCERRHARLMFGVAFPICLVAAALTRLAPKSRRGSITVFDGRHSLFKEATIAASMCIPFAIR